MRCKRRGLAPGYGGLDQGQCRPQGEGETAGPTDGHTDGCLASVQAGKPSGAHRHDLGQSCCLRVREDEQKLVPFTLGPPAPEGAQRPDGGCLSCLVPFCHSSLS